MKAAVGLPSFPASALPEKGINLFKGGKVFIPMLL